MGKWSLVLCLTLIALSGSAQTVPPWRIFPAVEEYTLENWLAEARAFLDEQPDNEGLRCLCEALDQLNLYSRLEEELIERWGMFVGDAVRERWPEDPEIADHLRRILDECAPHLDAAIRASEVEEIDFPPVDFEAEIPMRVHLRSLFDLLSLDIHRLLADGDPDLALERCLQAGRLVNLVRASHGIHLVTLMMTNQQMARACKLVSVVLQAPELTPEMVTTASTELAMWETQFRGADDCVAASRDLLIEGVHRLEASPEAQATLFARWATAEIQVQVREDRALWEEFSDRHLPMMISIARQMSGEFEVPAEWMHPPTFEQAMEDANQERQEWENILDDPRAFEDGINQLAAAIIADLERPPWEREQLDLMRHQSPWRDFFISQAGLRDLGEYATLTDVHLAHLRLARAMCALKLGDEEAFEAIHDPFSGEPFTGDGNRLRSLGPDCEDEGGMVLYDVTNGTVSSGDLVTPPPALPH